MSESDFKTKFSQGSEVLQSLFENGKSPLSGQFLRWKLWARWAEIVGPTLAQVSEPVAYHNGVLWLWVKNSSWLQQMVFMREDIRATIHKKMGVVFVISLRLTLDRRDVPQRDEDQEALKKALGKILPGTSDGL